MKRTLGIIGSLATICVATTAAAEVADYPVPSCSADDQCHADEVCLSGMCLPRDEYCQADDECGEYDICDTSLINDPGWGSCRIDEAAVPVEEACLEMCEGLAGCGAEPNATTDTAAAATQRCASMCSYTGLTGTGSDSLAGLRGCVETTTCDNMWQQCRVEGETWQWEVEAGGGDAGFAFYEVLPLETCDHGFPFPGCAGSGGSTAPLVLLVLLALGWMARSVSSRRRAAGCSAGSK